MKAGPELDELIALRIFGDTTKFERNYGPSTYPGIICDRFSTDIASAWKVVDKLHSMGIGWCIEQHPTTDKATVHFIPENPEQESLLHFVEDMERISDSSDSLPHAICLAALEVIK